MSQMLFCCPSCGVKIEIPQSKIPATANKCKCPSCRKLFPLTETLKPCDSSQRKTAEKAVASPQNPAANPKGLTDKYNERLDEALATLNSGNPLEAMLLLEEVDRLHSTPKVRSFLAYCRAKVKNEFSDAIYVCTEALTEEPVNADHYLNLGRIYLLANKRGPALKAFRKGIKLGPHPQLMQELRKYEMRKSPVLSSLHRDHFLNLKLGKLLTRFGMR